MKFGGTSVARPKNWEIIARLARKRLADGERVLIVHSALSGISNLLEALPGLALAGEGEAAAAAIRQRHLDFASEAGIDGPALLDTWFARLDALTAGMAVIIAFCRFHGVLLVTRQSASPLRE